MSIYVMHYKCNLQQESISVVLKKKIRKEKVVSGSLVLVSKENSCAYY